MKIGIDLFNFDPSYSGGVGTFALGIANGILERISVDDEIILLVSDRNEIEIRNLFKDRKVKFLTIPFPVWGRYVNRLLWMVSSAIGNYKLRSWYDSLLRRKICDQVDEAVNVIVAPLSLFSFYGFKSPSILCIHDIQQEYYPQLFTLNQRILRWPSYRLSCWKASCIQVSSNYIKQCILEKFQFVDEDFFLVAPEGVDLKLFSADSPSQFPAALDKVENQPFLFYPAQLWPHKNHLLLIKALSAFRDAHGWEVNCVLTGADYGYWSILKEEIQRFNLNAVHYLGRLDFQELIWLYKNCSAVLALGYHESSSLPAREGAAFGRPIICSDIPPNRETSDLLYLMLVDKSDPRSLADAIHDLFADMNSVLNKSHENIGRVRDLSWSRIAEIYLCKLRELHARRIS
jgi:glycosyltransferase involved in cell wall biosynthesis